MSVRISRSEIVCPNVVKQVKSPNNIIVKFLNVVSFFKVADNVPALQAVWE